MNDDDMLDEPINELEVSLGELVEKSVRATGRQRLRQDLYDMDYLLEGDPTGFFPEAFEHAYEHPTAYSALYLRGVASIDGKQLKLRGVSFDEAENVVLPAVRAAIGSANDLVKEEQARQKTHAEQKAQEAAAEQKRRREFIEKMKKPNG